MNAKNTDVMESIRGDERNKRHWTIDTYLVDGVVAVFFVQEHS